MKIIFAILILFVLLASQIYLLYANSNLKHEIALKNKVLDEQVTKYATIQPQFELGFQNIGCMIDREMSVMDTTNDVFKLHDVIKGNTLICRISDQYCTLCVEHNVSVLTDNKSDFDASKVLILSNSSNSRVFKLQIREYGLEKYNVFHCTDLGLHIDNIMFPYYMVVDSSLTVRAVYAPSKSTHGTDFDFKNVKLMYDTFVN